MNPGGVIESVRELLGQMSASHVKLYVEAYQADLAAQSLSRALKTLHNNIFAAAKVWDCSSNSLCLLLSVFTDSSLLHIFIFIFMIIIWF